MSLPFHISEECHSTTHSFLKGLSSLCFSILSSVVLHCSINSCFWEGVDIACQTFLLSSCIVLSFHTTTRKPLYRNSLLWEGINFININVYTYKFLSIISSIILHCSIISCFWERMEVACPIFFCHPALLCHSIPLGKNLLYPYSLLWEGIDFIHIYIYVYIYIYISFKNIFYHPSLLYQSMLLGEGGCCMSNFSFVILHCSVIPYPGSKTTLPLFTPLGRDWSYTNKYIFAFLSRISSNMFYHCSLLYQCMLLGAGGCCMSNFSFVILHCSVIPYHWEKTTQPYSLLWEGVVFIYINKFDSIISSVILHVSPLPNFRTMPFDHSFLSVGMDFPKVFNSFFNHFSLLYEFMLLGEGGCCMSNFYFVILHCSVIPYHWEKTTLPLFTPLGGIDFLQIYIFWDLCISFKNIFYHPSLLYQSMLLGRGGCYMSNFSFIILHCSVIPCY